MAPVLLHARAAHMESVGMIIAWAGAGVGSLLLILLVVLFLARRHRRRNQPLPDFLQVEVSMSRQVSRPDSLGFSEKFVDLEAESIPARELYTISEATESAPASARPRSSGPLSAGPLSAKRPASSIARPISSLARPPSSLTPPDALTAESVPPSPSMASTPRGPARSFRVSHKPPRLSLRLGRLSMVSSVFRGMRTPSTARSSARMTAYSVRTPSTAAGSVAGWAEVPEMPTLPPAARVQGARTSVMSNSTSSSGRSRKRTSKARSSKGSAFSWLTRSSADDEARAALVAKVGRRRVVDSSDFHPMNRARSLRAARPAA